MTALTLTRRVTPDLPVSLAPLTPVRLAGRDTVGIAKMKLACGNGRVEVGELFRVRAGDPARLRLNGGSRLFDDLGEGLEDGHIEIRGDAGARLGWRMRGGSIYVDGDTGLAAGAGMQGGRIIVTGHAGDFLGAAVPGEMEGMGDGVIHVWGTAGDRVGDRQRRGLIVVEGDAGRFCGSRMLAGTILVLGSVGPGVGCGMRRGTIVLRERPNSMSATFASCGKLKMEVLRLLFRQLRNSNPRLAWLEELGPLAERFAGDIARGGKGELLVLAGPDRE